MASSTANYGFIKPDVGDLSWGPTVNSDLDAIDVAIHNLAANAASDASTTVKGIVQLAGDLAGTATLPTVPGLAGKAATVHTHAEADVTSLTTDLAARVAKSTLTTKGDIYVATAAATPARLGVGAVGRAPVADPTATPGVAWGGPLSLRDLAFLPTGAIAESMPRASQFNSAMAFSSGVIYMSAIALPAGAVVNSITLISGSQAAVSPTHWWFGLYDNNRNQLAVTADQLTTAWAAQTPQTLVIATVAAGAASSFTTTYAGLYYVGAMMTAGTPVNTLGCQLGGGLNLITPTIVGSSNTGQTTPPAFPFQGIALTPTVSPIYLYVS